MSSGILLDSLPVDVIFEIGSFLDLAGLVAMTFTNRRFNSILIEHERSPLKNEITKVSFKSLEGRQIIEVILRKALLDALSLNSDAIFEWLLVTFSNVLIQMGELSLKGEYCRLLCGVIERKRLDLLKRIVEVTN